MDRALWRAMEMEIRVSFNAEHSNSTDLIELRVDIITSWIKAHLSEDRALLFSKPLSLKSINESLYPLQKLYCSFMKF